MEALVILLIGAVALGFLFTFGPMLFGWMLPWIGGALVIWCCFWLWAQIEYYVGRLRTKDSERSS